MKTLETNHGGNWLDQLLNRWPFCLHTDAVATIFALALDAQGFCRPTPQSLYANGYVMVRITFPFGLWFHVKPWRHRRAQVGAGWKLNGRLGATLRIQTDAKAAAGAHENAPNFGQAAGWERGTA